MNGEEFFNAINMIDDDLIEEAAVMKKTKRKNKTVFVALAACFAVVVSLSIVLGSLGGNMSINDVSSNKNQEVAENTTGNTSGGTGSAPESAQPEDSTEIYVPETAPAVSETVQWESGYSEENNGSASEGYVEYETAEGSSTPPQEAVTGADTSAPYIPEDTTAENTSDYKGSAAVFKAKIIEINGASVTVEPLQAPESNSSDRIVFSSAGLENINAKKGDIVIIGYDGLIMETYPAQIRAESWALAQ